MDIPTHDEVVTIWSATVERVGDECAVIVLPVPGDVFAVGGFRPNETIPLLVTIEGIVEQLLPIVEKPCGWMAMALPGYVQHVDADGPIPEHGDLQRLYEEDDESVTEVLTVLTLAYEDNAPVMMRSYVQPHLTPEGDADRADDHGPMAFSLRTGLLLANMPL